MAVVLVEFSFQLLVLHLLAGAGAKQQNERECCRCYPLTFSSVLNHSLREWFSSFWTGFSGGDGCWPVGCQLLLAQCVDFGEEQQQQQCPVCVFCGRRGHIAPTAASRLFRFEKRLECGCCFCSSQVDPLVLFGLAGVLCRLNLFSSRSFNILLVCLFSLVWPHSDSLRLCVQLIFKVVMQAASLLVAHLPASPFVSFIEQRQPSPYT